LFKSGIPIGTISIDDEILANYKKDKIVDFHKDFSQLKYVKVVSFLKEKNILDLSSKNDSETLNEEIKETNQRQETLRILLEQKKIADEIRIKIQKENNFLRNEHIRLKKESDFLRNESVGLKNEILILKINNQKNKIDDDEIEFLKKNLSYGHKCKKNIINNLYKVGTPEYRKCVLRKGLKE
jgi:rod shape-determining protein MreC